MCCITSLDSVSHHLKAPSEVTNVRKGNSFIASTGVRQLATRSWSLYDKVNGRSPSLVVPNSMLILNFGDTSAYRESRLRVVTVALNPSGEEFRAAIPWQRFIHATHGRGARRSSHYVRALDSYFRVDPYH